MESQTQDAAERSFLSDNLVKTVVIGGILGAAGVLLFRRRGDRGHTIPPIIIKSIDSGPDPIEIESEEQLYQDDRALDEKVKYKTGNFDFTTWVVVKLSSTSGDWVKYGFGRKRGLKVRLTVQVKQPGNQWVNEPGAPHLFIDGLSKNFPLTTEELSGDMPGNNHRPHKRRYKNYDNKKRRIGLVEVDGFSPLSTAGNEFVEIGFYDEDH